ncbi:MAG: V-type ATP synthase subunit F [Sphaerochaeta sp.]|uniref:V-type ATP synthase subunit F n=1 Tax=Sphaerochaeta sp. TaxID=1972642 RepID=UPI001D3A4F99|nr:V-type ATP synthase subunit F [uncultured Sphaerochaeta sp.]MDD3058292.1 V-type ATP synthase subunit F [Sphaerochaeta sp.]MDD3928361.1 V-type ATP synthase subunit F [Sphaerochaeta sp.]NCC91112.1 ATPase [Spirochaetia bacterium]
MKYFVIGDEDTVLGFSLVGVFGMQATNAEQAKRAWDKALEDPDNGIIIITDTVASLIRGTVDRYLFSESFPLVVEIPSPNSKEGRTDLRTLVNQAIGVSL